MSDEGARTAIDSLWDEIAELGLEPYVAQLDTLGYTAIPATVASPNGFCTRLLEAVLDVAERRRGVRPDMEHGVTHAGYKSDIDRVSFADAEDSPIGEVLQAILVEDPVFEEAVMNPVVLAMATYMCGFGVVLSSLNSIVKGPGVSAFQLHCDSPMPAPMPSYSVVGNCTYALTSYTRENGALAIVPGSHLWRRPPLAHESRLGEDGDARAIAVECEAGSLLCWHGSTWHGAFPRTAPGLRVNLIAYFSRPFLRPQEDLLGQVTQEMLDRNPARFGILTQQGVSSGYRSPEDFLDQATRVLHHLQAYPRAASREIY